MKELRWSEDKNKELQRTRQVTFEELVNSRFVDVLQHPTKRHQQLMLFELRGYIWVAPYVEEETYYFLKTAFPSRKYTQQYLQRGEG